jgi:oxaloacetate decarboxylase alpha subunit
MDVHFIDTTLRDGSQSLWASGMRTGMMEAVAGALGEAGFAAVEVPLNGILFKKIVRDLKEDPWELARRLARKMPNMVKGCMAGANLNPFGTPSPRAVAELFYEHLAAIGALNRAQMFANTYGQMENEFPWTIPMFRKLGLQVAIALSYTISPRHSDEYYAQKTRDLLPFKPDAIYLEDQCGILTIDRARTLLPAIVRSANGVPVELHAHNTTGLASLVYLEALQLGIRTLHTALPPLAEGPSQPSVFNIARNARLLGYRPIIDEKVLAPAAERLTAIARQEKLPVGAPVEYNYAQYIHQMPGGVISNLRHQLAELRLQHRLDEVLEESVQVRKDLCYPIMVTPHSQFVGTQAAINVATGERYKVVIDELILFARGVFGEDSGHMWMDQNLKDRLLGMRRAKELVVQKKPDIPLKELREVFGGTGVSDQEFLLRFIMKGTQEVDAMRAAGPPKPYYNVTLPLLSLIEELTKHKSMRYIYVQRGDSSLLVQNHSVP